jgi:hypothetical protein
MFEAIKPLIDSGILNEETREVLETAWNTKLDEARESIRSEIREEMAARYEHDKAVMVEALDRMVTDALTAEVEKLSAERAGIAEDRVKFTNSMLAKAADFDDYMKSRLADELKEFANDRAGMKQAVEKMDAYITDRLHTEISEFAEDKADLAATKVKVIREGKAKLQALRDSFVARSAKIVETTVSHKLRNELKQLKEDIHEAKQNNFGRKIFEAFATEFSATHLNERAEIKKMLNALAKMESTVSEANQQRELAEAAAAKKQAEINRINESIQRKDKLDGLLKPLSKDKAEVMKSLLESVPTARLEDAFKKYLGPVMDNRAPANKTVIAEAHVAVTGNREDKTESPKSNNIIEIRRLAGLTTN